MESPVKKKNNNKTMCKTKTFKQIFANADFECSKGE